MRISAILFGAKFGSAPSLFRSSQKKLRRFVSTVATVSMAGSVQRPWSLRT
jgi:hypothetical protein